MRAAGRRLTVLPTTPLGTWAVRGAAAAVLFVLAWRILPGGAVIGFACGLAGGVAGLVAVLRRGERALTVFLSLLPLAWIVVFLVAELLGTH